MTNWCTVIFLRKPLTSYRI